MIIMEEEDAEEQDEEETRLPAKWRLAGRYFIISILDYRWQILSTEPLLFAAPGEARREREDHRECVVYQPIQDFVSVN